MRQFNIIIARPIARISQGGGVTWMSDVYVCMHVVA